MGQERGGWARRGVDGLLEPMQAGNSRAWETECVDRKYEVSWEGMGAERREGMGGMEWEGERGERIGSQGRRRARAGQAATSAAAAGMVERRRVGR